MKKQYDIVGNRKKFFIFSAVLIVFILLFSVIFGVEMDIQFKGGAMLTYSYTGELDISAVQKDIESTLGSNVTLQTGSSIASDAQTLTISMPGTQTVETATVEALSVRLEENYSDNSFRQLSLNNVDPTIGKEFFAKSIVAVVAASLLILVYIAVRFKKIGGWPAGSMAVVALVHDLIVVYGVFVVMRIPLNGNFIAALLTILGYSINDTVVIYDRVRENRQLYGNSMDFATLVNNSINQMPAPLHQYDHFHAAGVGYCMRRVCGVRVGQYLYICVPAHHWHDLRCLQHNLYCRPAVGGMGIAQKKRSPRKKKA